MALSHEMKRLTEDYRRAYEGRMATLLSIRVSGADARRQTTQQLAAFDAAHRAMASQQREQMNKEMAELRQQVNELRREAATFVAKLDSAHRSMAAELDQRLSDEDQQLKKDVDKLLDDAATFLKAIDNATQHMASELDKWLSEQVNELRRTVSELRHEAATFVGELDTAHRAMATDLDRQLGAQLTALRHGMADLRKQMNVAHQSMSTTQRQWLHETRTARVSTRQRMSAEITATRTSLRRDQEEGRRAWSQFSAVMRQRRAGYTVAPAPAELVAAAPTEPVAPAPEPSAEPPLSERIMEFLGAHPEGVKLTELEETFHLNRIQMARHMNDLIAGGRVRRDDATRLYFVA